MFCEQTRLTVSEMFEESVASKYYSFVYEQVFVRDYLGVEVVQDEAMMDFAVHFAWFLLQTYGDKTIYLLINAIMRYRTAWAPWLVNMLGTRTRYVHQ